MEFPTEASKGSKKRKRGTKERNVSETHSTRTEEVASLSVPQKKKRKQPLNGLTLAVSTLDVKGRKHSSVDTSYQAVVALCKELGAQVTAQVHKKVFGVICNPSAVNQLTQRVRKAITKKYCPLVDVEWIRQCKLQGRRVDHEQYLLTELAQNIMTSRTNQCNVKPNNNDEIVEFCDNDDIILQSDVGWSEPVSLDCCCVCHDDNRDDCMWCVECNVTLAKKAREYKK